MKLLRYYVLMLTLLTSQLVSAQSQDPAQVNEPEFQKMLQKLLQMRVAQMDVDELHADMSDYVILDSREQPEYETSHIDGAIHVGYNKLKRQVLQDIPKDAQIVVYCSVGYRSERVAYQLQKQGYTNVKNLYGSIFEWANRGYPLVSADGATTDVHTYNRKWSQWMTNPAYTRVW